MHHQVYETETFTKLYGAMEKVEQEWVDKIKQQLIENPQTGKPLRFDWFREKKFGDKRMYYLVYKNVSKILLVSFGSNNKIPLIYGKWFKCSQYIAWNFVCSKTNYLLSGILRCSNMPPLYDGWFLTKGTAENN